jgi:hypothetical protein
MGITPRLCNIDSTMKCKSKRQQLRHFIAILMAIPGVTALAEDSALQDLQARAAKGDA